MLDRVAHAQSNVVADVDPRVREPVREPRAAIGEFGVGQAPITADDGDARGHRVGDGLEEIREVELHRPPPLRSGITSSLRCS